MPDLFKNPDGWVLDQELSRRDPNKRFTMQRLRFIGQ